MFIKYVGYDFTVGGMYLHLEDLQEPCSHTVMATTRGSFVRQRDRDRHRGSCNLSPDSVITAAVAVRTNPTSLPILTWAIGALFNIPRSLVNLCSAGESGIVLAYLKALPLAVHFSSIQLRVALWWMDQSNYLYRPSTTCTTCVICF
jgi:hypothetical protein